MIHMRDNIVSQKYVKVTKPSWEEKGFTVKLVQGCTPETISHYSNEILEFDTIKSHRPRDFSPTEKAIWYSHHKLWQLSAVFQENIIVAEHDALLIRHFDSDYFTNNESDYTCFCHGDARKYPAARGCWCKDCARIKEKRHQTVGGAYYITPTGATQLIGTLTRAITINSDGHIGRIAKEFAKLGQKTIDHTYSFQYTNMKWGTTIDHSREIIGESWSVDHASI